MNAREARSNLEAEADMLVQAGLDRLESIYWENGGAGWLYEEPRYHMWKGIDELFSATHHAHEGDIEAMEERIQDGLNHIWMASFIAQGGGETDPLLMEHPGSLIHREVFGQISKTSDFTAVIDGELHEGRLQDFDIRITEGDPDE